MSCAEFEILLCDAVDETLHGERKAAFEQHRASCPACDSMASDVLGVTAFISRTAVVEPPKELLTRILFETTGGKKPGRAAHGSQEPAGWLSRLKALFEPVRQPRLAMGMAMTILSVSMLAQVFGFEMRQMRSSDLEPAQIWASVEDGAHRQWTRVVKYYENLRVVFEIQSRLKEWAEQEEQDRQGQTRGIGAGQPKQASPNRSSDGAGTP